MRHARPTFLAVLLLPVLVAGCSSLSLVQVSAPDINCRFDLDCTITVDDFVDPIPVPFATPDGRLQSRTQPPGEPGTPGQGLFAYEYRIDLRQAAGLTAIVCVDSLSMEFGPIAQLDYDLDGSLDDAYVITAGGLGTVAPSRVRLSGETVTFSFVPPVCPGNAPGNGESSYFFGLASTNSHQSVTASVHFDNGTVETVAARAPN